MSERPQPDPEFDSYYYHGSKEQVVLLLKELKSQGFLLDSEIADLEPGEEAFLLKNEDGHEILITNLLSDPENRYTIEVDAPLTLLVEESFANLKLDNAFIETMREYRRLVPPPADPSSEEDKKDSTSKFHVWEDKTEDEIEELKDYLEDYYPELTKITGQYKKLTLEEDMVFYKLGHDLIVIFRQSYTDNSHLFRVKVNPALVPILQDYWGPENAPPIEF